MKSSQYLWEVFMKADSEILLKRLIYKQFSDAKIYSGGVPSFGWNKS